jgi:chromosome segregation ATPase
MKGNILIIFAVLGIAVGAGTTILLSNAKDEIEIKNVKIDTQNVKIDTLQKEKVQLKESKKQLTQDLSTANSKLTKTQGALSELKDDYSMKVTEYETFVGKVAQELAAKDEKISELNGELQTAQNKNQDYDSQIKGLNSQMADKDRAIDDIGRRLESAEEDRDHLLQERNKLIAEKAELEKQFQDILVLRQKVQQLQVELMASKKLEWLRRGFYGSARKKGGSRLMGMSKRNDRKTVSPTNADLNVEVRRDGTVKIVPIETNSPPSGATP